MTTNEKHHENTHETLDKAINTDIIDDVSLKQKEKTEGTERTERTEKIEKTMKTESAWKKHNLYHESCVIINYIVISGTLILITYFLYGLTEELRKIDFQNINNSISSLENNLQGIKVFGDKITIYFDEFQNSGFIDIDVDKLNQLIYDLNSSLIRLNNGIDNLQPKLNTDINFDGNSNTQENDLPTETSNQNNIPSNLT